MPFEGSHDGTSGVSPPVWSSIHRGAILPVTRVLVIQDAKILAGSQPT
jgi:hypothetical protein